MIDNNSISCPKCSCESLKVNLKSMRIDGLVGTICTSCGHAVNEDDIKQMATEPAMKAIQTKKGALARYIKDNPAGAIGLVIFLLVFAIFLYVFLRVAVTDGWDAASIKSPLGKIVFFILLGIAYFLSIPWLRDKGGKYREVANVMLKVAGITFALFVVSIMPTCNSNRGGELHYYRR